MDWLVVIVGLIGFVLAGRKIWWAWYINLGCQALWVIYGVISHQYAFIVSALVYSVVFGQNAYKWTKEHNTKKERNTMGVCARCGHDEGVHIPGPRSRRRPCTFAGECSCNDYFTGWED